MNNTSKKIISILLCASLLTGTIGAGVYNSYGKDAGTPAVIKSAEIAELQSSPSAEKDETVWVLAGADGSVNKIIVSDWLKNTSGADKIADVSALTGIGNVKGNESFTENNGSLVWETGGKDIYYQGTSKKELPVNVSISYQLDGKNILPEELAGKSGKVTIRFEYSVNVFEMREIEGKEEKIYVPFAMLTGMALDNDVFRNIEVTNGKMINDGTRTIVAGIAFPELQESLGIGRDIVEIPDFIEITADVSDFSMGMTATIATNKVFNDLDTDKLNSGDELSSSLTELTDAMTQLSDGSDALYDGLCQLLEKSGELTDGVNKLAEGSGALADGAKKLESGSAELQTGTAQLNSGLQELSRNNSTLNGGAKQVFDTLLSAANTQIEASGLSVPTLTVENYGDVLDQTIASLDETNVYNQALAQVTAAVNAQRDLVSAQVEAAVRQQVTQQVQAAVIQQFRDKGLTDEMLQSSEMQAQISALTEGGVQAQMESEQIKATVAEQTELQIQQLIAENMMSDSVQSSLSAASDGVQALAALKSQLDSYNAFYSGLLTYTSGVAQAAAGADKLKSGVDSLKSGATALNKGAGELNTGIKQLKDSTPALIEGITQLRDGSKKLSEGFGEFNEQVVEKIAGALDGDLTGISQRISALKSVSGNYRSYSGIDDDSDGTVKFFFRMDGIEK